jgi:two-component system alkaline phosphatase synthesis response regulator PhoP
MALTLRWGSYFADKLAGFRGEVHMRVLIVDDDKYIRRLVRSLLEAEGMECHEAEDGLRALTVARQLHPDIMILDIMLPGLDGYKVSRMLKFDDEYADISIIMLTSRAEPTDKETGYYTGADVYITKPFDQEELVNTVKQLAASQVPAT